jgi:hypothetical protein
VADIPASGIIFKDSINIEAFRDPKVGMMGGLARWFGKGVCAVPAVVCGMVWRIPDPSSSTTICTK